MVMVGLNYSRATHPSLPAWERKPVVQTLDQGSPKGMRREVNVALKMHVNE